MLKFFRNSFQPLFCQAFLLLNSWMLKIRQFGALLSLNLFSFLLQRVSSHSLGLWHTSERGHSPCWNIYDLICYLLLRKGLECVRERGEERQRVRACALEEPGVFCPIILHPLTWVVNIFVWPDLASGNKMWEGQCAHFLLQRCYNAMA